MDVRLLFKAKMMLFETCCYECALNLKRNTQELSNLERADVLCLLSCTIGGNYPRVLQYFCGGHIIVFWEDLPNTCVWCQIKVQGSGNYCTRTVLLPSLLGFCMLEWWEKCNSLCLWHSARVQCNCTVVTGYISGKQLTLLSYWVYFLYTFL